VKLVVFLSFFLFAYSVDGGTSCIPGTVLAAIHQSRDQLCPQLLAFDSELSTTTACVKRTR
jgi:hypothetical protein